MRIAATLIYQWQFGLGELENRRSLIQFVSSILESSLAQIGGGSWRVEESSQWSWMQVESAL